jgi:squalene cyclase
MASEVGQQTPAMDELAQRLQALTQGVAYLEQEDVPGDFEITHVEPKGLWLHDHMDDSVYGSVLVPKDVHDHCTVGWMISATLGRRDGAYQFVDVLNVDP